MSESEYEEEVDSQISGDEGDTDDDRDTELSSHDDDGIISNKKNLLNELKILSHNETYSQYYSKIRITKPFLTKYEKAKILGIRSQMLSNGSHPMINVSNDITDTLDIAKEELKQGVIPLFIRRYLPNKEYEDWRIEELVIN